MKIVIDIPDNIYDAIKSAQTMVSGQRSGKTLLQILVSSVENGTPLPKGHGDLIDRTEAIKNLFDYHNGKKTIGQCIDNIPTIIEAEREEE